ncbi:MAG: BlaI/MecI/CopY family transcriptional regulator [Lachnospiraceae bacterium]|nr:BlaI/MecI/CopY family transcriptional regulator [Lachnospiraceae bacterium]
MPTIQLGIVESQFADMIWDHAPVSSSELVHLAQDAFGWKRTTTHTVIKRLCEKGLFVNNNGIISTVLAKEDFYAQMSKEFVDTNFNGSLPYFVSCFTKNAKLSKNDIDLIRSLLKESKE